jgi:hypothetical protein
MLFSRKAFRGQVSLAELGITVEEWQRSMREFRERLQPPPVQYPPAPRPTAPITPSYTERQTATTLCDLARYYGEAEPGSREQRLYADEFMKRYNAMSPDTQDFYYDLMAQLCPMAAIDDILIEARQQPPPPGEPVPSPPVYGPYVPPPMEPIIGPPIQTVETMPEYGYYQEPREFAMPAYPPTPSVYRYGLQPVPTGYPGALRAAERAVEMAPGVVTPAGVSRPITALPGLLTPTGAIPYAGPALVGRYRLRRFWNDGESFLSDRVRFSWPSVAEDAAVWGMAALGDAERELAQAEARIMPGRLAAVGALGMTILAGALLGAGAI